MLLLVGTPVLAQNPDGNVGTIWIEGSANVSALGQWEMGRTASFPAEQDDFRRMALGGRLGVVVAPQLTLGVGISWDHSNAQNLVSEYETQSQADYVQNALMMNIRMRIYLNN
jgi:hypothetical protein